MSTCCDQNAPPGGCRQGRNCPVHAARAAALVKRTREALDMNPCPSWPPPERHTDETAEKRSQTPLSNTGDTCIFWGVVLAMLLITVTLAYFAFGYVWGQVGNSIERLFWSAASLLF